MNEEKYRAQYGRWSSDALKEEKLKQQDIIEKQTALWRTTSLGGPITAAAIGMFLTPFLIGIPFLVIGTVNIVNRAKLRNSCNQAIYQARDRIAVIDILLAERDDFSAATEAEVVDAEDKPASDII